MRYSGQVLFLIFLLIVCPAYSGLLARPSHQPSDDQIIAQFQGKWIETKITLGGALVVHDDVLKKDVERLVDTEAWPGGQVKYFVRRGYAGSLIAVLPGGYVDPDKLTGNAGPGTSVFVRRVTFKDDRIEFALSRSGNSFAGVGDTAQDYGKLKLMLGRDYRTWPYDRLLSSVATAVKVEALDRGEAIAKQNQLLRQALVAAESEYQDSDSKEPEGRLKAASALRDVCLQLAENTKQVASLGGADTESAALSNRAAALNREIQTLREALPGQAQSSDGPSPRMAAPGLSSTATSVEGVQASLSDPNVRPDAMTVFHGPSFSIMHPENWPVGPYSGSAAILMSPPGGTSGRAVSYGVLVGDNLGISGGSIEEQTDGLVKRMCQQDHGLEVAGSVTPIRVAGLGGRSVEMMGPSPIRQGGQALKEHDWVVTLPRSKGKLLYVVFTSPERDFGLLLPTFQQMLDTLQLQ